jgi:CRISPR/Cas system-associated protein Cas10 (large subunit of type III CRISPR-Cas system)
MPLKSNDWLVSFDTDKIKNYIFATNNLKEVRGASALLVREDEKRKTLLAELIYAAGGGGTLLAGSPEKADALIKAIEREFGMATKTATITAVGLSPSERNDLNSNWFGRHMAEAAKKLQKKKSQKVELSLLPVEPYMRLCDSCGHQPAEKRLEKDPTNELLCESCVQKRETGKEERREGFVTRFLNHVKSSESKFKETWQDQELKLPKDLNALGDLDGGYVGFLYFDGNQMGKLLELMETEDNYRDFSKELAATVQELVFETLIDTYQKPSKGRLPFEIVLIGGDDVMLFTTASAAMQVAVTFMQRFEKRSEAILHNAGLLQPDLFGRLQQAFGAENMPIDENEPFWKNRRLTMAAGVVLCHANFPIPALVEIAERLLKNAKKKCAENKYAQSAIDFQVVTGSAIDLDMIRANVPHCRPYTRSGMEQLLKFVKRFHQENFPRTQLQMIYDACHQESRAHGTMATLHTLARLRERNQRQLLKEFFVNFHPNSKPLIHWPWISDELGLKTAFVDLVDLYDFIGKEANHDGISNEN